MGRAVREDVQRRDTGDRWMILEEPRHRVQSLCGQEDVRVQEKHQLAGRSPVRLIDRHGESQVLVVLDERDVGSSCECLRRAVDGSVVNDDDLARKVLRRPRE